MTPRSELLLAPCPRCHGSGSDPHLRSQSCLYCWGEGSYASAMEIAAKYDGGENDHPAWPRFNRYRLTHFRREQRWHTLDCKLVISDEDSDCTCDPQSVTREDENDDD